MDPMLDMANRVAGLPQALRNLSPERNPAPMHQSLEGEARRFCTEDDGPDGLLRLHFEQRGDCLTVIDEEWIPSQRAAALRERVRAALLEDWPVSGVERLEAAVERVCRAVEEE